MVPISNLNYVNLHFPRATREGSVSWRLCTKSHCMFYDGESVFSFMLIDKVLGLNAREQEMIEIIYMQNCYSRGLENMKIYIKMNFAQSPDRNAT